MESTFVPLELFFEHRNYLPAMFMFWPLAVWLTDDQARLLHRGLAMLILIIMAALTWSGAQVWGDSRQQALIWAKTNPDSARAQAVAASTEMARGDYIAAISRLRTASAKQPNEVQLTLNLVDAECATGQISPSTWQLTLFSLRHTANASKAILSWFTDSIQRAKGHACNGLTLTSIRQALQAIQDNPLYEQESGFRQDFAHISGLLAISDGHPDVALDEFNRALAEQPDLGTALEQAAALGASGYPAYGLQHLDFAQAQELNVKIGLGMPRLHDWILSNQGYWQHETAVLRSTLKADAAKQTAKSPSHAG
jgi:predicted Zn-dependent protease